MVLDKKKNIGRWIMDDRELRTISFITFLIGLFGIFLVSQFSKPIKLDMNNLSKEYIGRNVIVTGKVLGSFRRNGNLFFKLGNNGKTLNAVAFSSSIDVRKNDEVEVEGRLKIYKGDLEIVVSKVRLIG